MALTITRDDVRGRKVLDEHGRRVRPKRPPVPEPPVEERSLTVARNIVEQIKGISDSLRDLGEASVKVLRSPPPVVNVSPPNITVIDKKWEEVSVKVVERDSRGFIREIRLKVVK